MLAWLVGSGNAAKPKGFVKVKAPPIDNVEFANPICRKNITNNTQELIVIPSTKNNADNAGTPCFKYDIQSDKYDIFSRYPCNIQPYDHTYCINTNLNQLYSLGGSGIPAEQFVIYDFNQNKWITQYHNDKTDNNNSILYTGGGPQSLFIPEYNEIHILFGSKSNSHYKWDITQEKWIKLATFNDISGCYGHGFIWLPKIKSFLLFGGMQSSNNNNELCETRSIWMANYYDQNNNKLIWNQLNDCSLPFRMHSFGFIFYRNRFIIIFGGLLPQNGASYRIRILDISTFEWTESTLRCPVFSCSVVLVQDLNNKIEQDTLHIFSNEHDKGHWKIFVNEILSLKQVKVISDAKYDDKILDNIDDKKDNDDQIDLKAENLKLKQQNKALMDKYRVLEIQYNKMKLLLHKTQKQKKKILNLNEYMSWNCDDVLCWMISLQSNDVNKVNIFQKYEDILRNKLNEENIKGQDLQYLDKNDLHRLGITEFKDKRDMLKYIADLVYNTSNQMAPGGNMDNDVDVQPAAVYGQNDDFQQKPIQTEGVQTALHK